MKAKKMVLAGALILVLVTAGFVLARQFSGPRLELRPSAVAGEVMAKEAAKLFGSSGDVVVIAFSSANQPGTETAEEISSFETALKRQSSPKLSGTEWLPETGGMMRSGGVSEAQLAQVLDKYPNANGVVIFAGLPPLSASLSRSLSARSLKVMAVCGCSALTRQWLESRLLALSVIPRVGDPPAGTPKNAEGWFQQQFQLVTPDTVGQLPY